MLNQSSKKVQDIERGKRLRNERRRLGLSQLKIAEKAGVSKGSQILYEKGNPPTADYLCAIGDIGVDIIFVLSGRDSSNIEPRPGTSVRKLDGTILAVAGKVQNPEPDRLKGEQIHSEFIPIPKLTVSASAGNGAINDIEDSTGYYAFSQKWIERRNLKAQMLAVITVSGDSMEPKLRDNDLILVDRDQTSVKDGKPYVVRIGDELLVKYVQRLGEDQITLLSANTFYPPRTIDLLKDGDSIQIIGRVVASMHEW